jgi:hypothetical protein
MSLNWAVLKQFQMNKTGVVRQNAVRLGNQQLVKVPQTGILL